MFLPGESHGQRSLAGYSPQDHKDSDKAEGTEHAERHISTLMLTECVLISSNTQFNTELGIIMLMSWGLL